MGFLILLSTLVLCLNGIVEPERNIDIIQFLVKCFYRTAIGMAADNDVFNLEMLDRIFKYRGKIPVMDRGDIADIPLDEQDVPVSSG